MTYTLKDLLVARILGALEGADENVMGENFPNENTIKIFDVDESVMATIQYTEDTHEELYIVSIVDRPGSYRCTSLKQIVDILETWYIIL